MSPTIVRCSLAASARGGLPLSLTPAGETAAVLRCDLRDAEATRHLRDMGVGPGAVLDIVSNEDGRVSVSTGDCRIGIDAESARRIHVAPAPGERPRSCGRHHGRCGCGGCGGGCRHHHQHHERNHDMRAIISASILRKGQAGVVQQIKGDPAISRRLRDMGLAPGAAIRCAGVAPLGDPIEVEIMGYRLSLRKSEAEGVLVEVEA